MRALISCASALLVIACAPTFAAVAPLPGESVAISPDGCIASVIFDHALLAATADSPPAHAEQDFLLGLRGRHPNLSFDARGSWIGGGLPSVRLNVDNTSVQINPTESDPWVSSYQIIAEPGIKRFALDIQLTPPTSSAGEMQGMAMITVDSLEFTIVGCQKPKTEP